MTTAALIFPHQLFADHPALEDKPARVLLVEEPLFFGDPQYPARFHKLKLAYHRATMMAYARAVAKEPAIPSITSNTNTTASYSPEPWPTSPKAVPPASRSPISTISRWKSA